MRLDLDDLRLFLAVVRAGSLTAGASAAHLALASVSQRIAAMEDELGSKLLVRQARGVRPTPAGAALVRHAQELLQRAQQMQADLQGFASGKRGRVRVLTNSGGMLGFLPAALSGFLAAHPGIDVALEERASESIVPLLAQGAADLGVVRDTVEPGALEAHFLRDDRLVVLVSAQHPLAKKQQIAFARLGAEPFVGLRQAAVEQHLAAQAERHGFALRYRVHLPSVRAVGAAVALGVGIAIVPEAAAVELRGLGLRRLALTDPWAQRRLVLCLRRADELAAPARLLLEHLRAQR